MSRAGHPSRSDAQAAAEVLIRAELSLQMGIELTPRRLSLESGAVVDVDAVAPDETVLVEIFARQGRLKSGQRHKIQGDALKLITLARSKPTSRLILAFCDELAAAGVVGWLAEAIDVAGIEIWVIDLPDDVRAGLVEAQLAQVMVNPPVGPIVGDDAA